MATAWSKESEWKINFTKLCRLIIDGGTSALRYQIDIKYPNLGAALASHRPTLQSLKNKKRLNDIQWNKLYPPSGINPKSEDFDITLLFVLVRNICGLTPPATGWDVLPPITDKSIEANLARIKYYRNNTLAHKPNTEIIDVDFEQYWQDISSALVSLGISQIDIDKLKSDPVGIKDYKQLIDDWSASDGELSKTLHQVQCRVGGVETSLQDVSCKVDSLTVLMTEQKKTCINVLPNHEFTGLINSLCKSFHPNTRQWILDQVKSHIDSDQPESCIMGITAGPGMGKSTIAAKICEMYKNIGCLGGCHFFQFSDSTRNNPRLMLQSIARQMCDSVPGYKEALESKLVPDIVKKISSLRCEELFTVMFEESLFKMKNDSKISKKIILVIDALDECSNTFSNEIIKVLRDKTSLLPSWIRIVITTRPSSTISELTSKNNLNIYPANPQNRHDLKTFFNDELKKLYPNFDDLVLTGKLVQMSKGLFLVAFYVMDFLKKQKIASPSDVLELFPNGISSIFENYFHRLKEILSPYLFKEESFFKMLEAIVSAKNPLPIDMLYNILGLQSEREVPRQERKTRKDALNSLHSLFPVKNDHVTAFHKSVVDWLILEGDEQHEFSVRVEDGNEVLANQCYDVLSDIRNGRIDVNAYELLDRNDNETFALRFGLDLIHGCLTVSKEKKTDIFTNFYVISWFVYDSFPRHPISKVQWPQNLSCYLKMTLEFATYIFCDAFFLRHKKSCSFYHHVRFRHYLDFFLHTVRVMEDACPMKQEDISTLNPTVLLENHQFPYYDRKTIVSLPSDFEIHNSFPYEFEVLAFDNGFAFPCESGISAPSLAVYQLSSGNCSARRSFPGFRETCISPDQKYLVLFEKKGKRIEIRHILTLELAKTYECPKDAIETCHVFGDELWYVVIKCGDDNRIYVIEGLTGQLKAIIEVEENETLEAVSSRGHILISKSKMEVYEQLDWEIDSAEMMKRVQLRSESINEDARKLYVCNYKNPKERISINYIAEEKCTCRSMIGPGLSTLDRHFVGFSQDGSLVAYMLSFTLFIISTCDGSLIKSVSLGLTRHAIVIDLVISDTYWVMFDGEKIVFLNWHTNEYEHRLYVHGMAKDNEYEFVDLDVYPRLVKVMPTKKGEPFSLLVLDSIKKEMSQYVFHNINL